MLQDEHRLEKSRDAGRGFQVAEIRFDRANRQRRVRRAIDAERFRERMRLDRIAHRGAGAMRFDKTDLLPVQLPRPRRRPAPGAPAPPGSAEKCRWCVRPD